MVLTEDSNKIFDYVKLLHDISSIVNTDTAYLIEKTRFAKKW